MPASFIDTNVLVYLAAGSDAKAAMAESVVREGGVVSVQVLNEIANVAHRKIHLEWREIRDFLDLLQELLSVVPVTSEIHEVGLGLAERHRLSIYDAMIVAAALTAGCDRLWSEDLQHGMVFERRLRVSNPFRAPNAA